MLVSGRENPILLKGERLLTRHPPFPGLCALSTLITLFFLPETQGLSREELDGVFEYALYVVWFGKYRVDNAMILNKWATGPALGEEKLRSEDEEHVEVVSEKRQ